MIRITRTSHFSKKFSLYLTLFKTYVQITNRIVTENKFSKISTMKQVFGPENIYFNLKNDINCPDWFLLEITDTLDSSFRTDSKQIFHFSTFTKTKCNCIFDTISEAKINLFELFQRIHLDDLHMF